MRRWIKWAAAALLTGSLLAGCSKDDSSSTTTTGDTGGVVGLSRVVAVDPYLKDAVFQELHETTGAIIQTSTPSDANGVANFPGAIAPNSVISLDSRYPGLHAGLPFFGKLKRRIAILAAGTEIVANPLTTLLADGKSEAEVIDLMNSLGGGSFNATSIYADPMAGLQGATISDAAKNLLAINMAVNTAVQVVGNSNDLTALQGAAAPVVTMLKDIVFVTLNATNIAAVTGTGVTLTTTLAENSTPATISADATTVGAQAAEVLAMLTANPNTPVTIPTIGALPVALDNTELARSYFTAGQAALNVATASNLTSDFVTAIKKFKAAAVLANSITDPTLKDKVLFFGAMANVMEIANPLSDLTDNGLNNFGDILDAFGLTDTPVATNAGRTVISEISLEKCSTDPYGYTNCNFGAIESDAPTSGTLQTFMYEKIGAALKDAVTKLDSVSPAFTAQITDATTNEITEFDAADAKFISALANGILAQINLQQAYNVDVNLYNQQFISLGPTEQTADDFLAAHPALGTLKDVARLADFKTYANASITSLEAAIVAMQAETDNGTGQMNDFIKLEETECAWNPSTQSTSCTTTMNDPVQIDEFKVGLTDAKAYLNGTKTDFVDDNGTPSDPTDDAYTAINIGNFFAGVDLRSKLPSSFNNGAFGDLPGPLPDPTFGGVLVQIGGQPPSSLNADLDGDGAPDFFDGFSYLQNSFLNGKTYRFNTSGKNWSITFNASNSSFTGILNDSSTMIFNEAISGTYAINNNNVLTLNLNLTKAFYSKIVATLDSTYEDDHRGFDMTTVLYNSSNALVSTNAGRWDY